ncbi:MAG: PIG-L family deacetylase, partial [Gemmatimonadaceae bacterium]
MIEVDILAIAAHRDDVELTCGGALIRSARQGHTTAIIDLTAGESGTRGSAALRGRESDAAAQILGVSERVNLGLPDAALVNTPDTRTL